MTDPDSADEHGSAESMELAAIARDAAERGGELAAEAFTADRAGVRHKGDVDLVTETDLAVEAYLRDRLSAETGFGFLGEEHGRTGPSTGPVWIVDPIDGTTNFASRVPHFGVSVALWTTGPTGRPESPITGCVVSPIAGETFWCDHEHAWLGDDVLPALEPRPLDECLVASGFPTDRRTNDDDNTDLWRAAIKRCLGVRRFGAASLDLCWLAAGRVDGFWEPRLKAWDVAAGLAILARVGGRASDYSGAPHRLDSPTIVAGHPEIVSKLIEVIREAWRARP